MAAQKKQSMEKHSVICGHSHVHTLKEILRTHTPGGGLICSKVSKFTRYVVYEEVYIVCKALVLPKILEIFWFPPFFPHLKLKKLVPPSFLHANLKNFGLI